MKQLEIGAKARSEVMPKAGDLASALGNSGVDVVSSPATIGYLEMVCHELLDPNYEAGEATVGIGFNLRHLAAARPDRPLELSAELISQKDNRRFTFKVVATQGGKVIMSGEHERAVVPLKKFLEAL